MPGRARRLLLLGLAALLAAGTFLAASTSASATATTCPTTIAPVTNEQIDRVFALAAKKFQPLAQRTRKRFPFGAAQNSTAMDTTNLRGWTSGFFPASTWLIYQNTNNPRWLDLARAWTKAVLPVASWTGTHDLGFMVGLPAALGVELDPSAKLRTDYRKAMLTASESLSSRWNAKVGAFKSGEYDGQWGLIMDSAMNAPLLITRGQQLGGSRGAQLEQRGTQHLLTLARTFIRPDGSTYHRLAFDTSTGALTGPVPGQGADPDSAWARGQSWAIYGFAQGAALTGDQTLLAAAQTTADYWLSKVPNGCIPAWDLDIDTPGALHDSSASAIAANGLLLLATLTTDQAKAEAYRTAALTSLGTLASEEWTPTTSPNPGLLQKQTYNVPKYDYEGSYSWGDTYLLQALRTARPLIS
ncbi:MAG: glycoside hydrolase family 88 protein [Actinomycetales bacterium]|nr:glycoside hydrolase family 88 protein [Actinomycetales bacterium]